MKSKSSFHIKVHVFPDSKKETVKNMGEHRLSICVREPAQDNVANKRVLKLVRNLYPGTMIRMISGHHSSHKILECTRDDS